MVNFRAGLIKMLVAQGHEVVALAADWLGIPGINSIAGVGAVFIQDGWLVPPVRRLYRTVLFCSAKVFF